MVGTKWRLAWLVLALVASAALVVGWAPAQAHAQFVVRGQVTVVGGGVPAGTIVEFYPSPLESDLPSHVPLRATVDEGGAYATTLPASGYDIAVVFPVDSGILGMDVRPASVGVSADLTADLRVTPTPSTPLHGRLVDALGEPMEGVQVEPNPNISSPIPTLTDADGVFLTAVPVGTSAVSCSCQEERGCTHGGSSGVGLAVLTLPGPLGAVGMQEVVWPLRPLTGVVRSAGRPVAGATVIVYSSNAPGEVRGAATFWNGPAKGTTDAEGRYSLPVMPGEIGVQVEPDRAQGAAGVWISHDLPDQIPSPPLDITLPETLRYAGYVQDSLGQRIAGATVELRDADYRFVFNGVSDANGDFSVEAGPSATVLTVFCGGDTCAHFGGVRGASLQLPSLSVDRGEITDAAIEWPVASNAIQVQDVDGLPLAGVRVNREVVAGLDGRPGSGAPDVVTDAAGQVSMFVPQGLGYFRFATGDGDPLTQLLSDDASGFEFLAVSDRTSDAPISPVTLQFRSEQAAGLGIAGTDRESDGATALDPVETASLSAAGGDVSIVEHPIAVAPPAGTRFLTQQVSFLAPKADEVTITLALDASRIPSGRTRDDVSVFHDGVRLGVCQEPPSRPCLASVQELEDGDLAFSVLAGGGAHELNFGVPGEPLPSCTTADACVVLSAAPRARELGSDAGVGAPEVARGQPQPPRAGGCAVASGAPALWWPVLALLGLRRRSSRAA